MNTPTELIRTTEHRLELLRSAHIKPLGFGSHRSQRRGWALYTCSSLNDVEICDHNGDRNMSFMCVHDGGVFDAVQRETLEVWMTLKHIEYVEREKRILESTLKTLRGGDPAYY